jgi:site-specific recombinase XerD
VSREGFEPTTHGLKVQRKLRPLITPARLIASFLESRPDGSSSETLRFYNCYLKNANSVVGIGVPASQIRAFFDKLPCSQGGKYAYFKVLRVFYKWLYSYKSGLGLNIWDNPMLSIEAPKVGKRILPSHTEEQLEYIIGQAEGVRNKAIISLLADSGLRVAELANIDLANIDWKTRRIRVITKGNKEGLALFGPRTETLLHQWLAEYNGNGKLWDTNAKNITYMLRKLTKRTGLPCNPHTFRRTFASLLAKKGIDSLHIMRLGRWESLQMVELYTRSVKVEDSLKFYQPIC